MHHDTLPIQRRHVPHGSNERGSVHVQPPRMLDGLDAIPGHAAISPSVFNCCSRDIDVAVDGPFVADVVADAHVVSFRDRLSVHGPRDLGQGVASGRALEGHRLARVDGQFREGVGEDWGVL